MKRESTFFLRTAIAQMVAILFVLTTWILDQVPDTIGESLLRVGFFALALLVMLWTLSKWAEYRRLEDSNTNK